MIANAVQNHNDGSIMFSCFCCCSSSSFWPNIVYVLQRTRSIAITSTATICKYRNNIAVSHILLCKCRIAEIAARNTAPRVRSRNSNIRRRRHQHSEPPLSFREGKVRKVFCVLLRLVLLLLLGAQYCTESTVSVPRLSIRFPSAADYTLHIGQFRCIIVCHLCFAL